MQKRPLTIALALAGLIAGTSAGIAAMNSEATTAADPVALQSATEMKAPESQAALPASDVLAPVGDMIAQAPADMTAPKATTAAAPMRTPPPPAARSTDDERMVRVPFTDYYVRVTNPTFPSAGQELPEPTYLTIAYFERLEANRLAASQPAPVAPVASLDLPASGTLLKTEQATTQASLGGN